MTLCVGGLPSDDIIDMAIRTTKKLYPDVRIDFVVGLLLSIERTL